MPQKLSGAVRPRLVQALAAIAFVSCTSAFAQSGTASSDGGSPVSGPIRLRQPQSATPSSQNGQAQRGNANGNANGNNAGFGNDPTQRGFDQTDNRPFDDRGTAVQRYRPGEFERYVQRIANNPDIRRLGAELVVDNSGETDPQDTNPVVPADYVVSAGDEVVVTMWGSVDADLRLTVDRAGRILIPRVGSVLVAGVKYQDLAATIDRQARRVFKNFELTASLGQLRGVRVLVTGFAERPGAYSASSLASVSSVLFRAGGPSASGSFRDIELRRQGKLVSRIDLYDLIARGQHNADALVQAGDIIHVGPVGRQVGMLGSINKPAVIELKAGETLGDALQMVGGFSSVADRTRVAVEQLDERNDVRIRQVAWPDQQALGLSAGDVVRVFSAVASMLPLERQNKRVRIEGEVLKPGEFILPPRSSVRDLIRQAGGFTSAAYIFGTEFSRETVRLTQQQNYERALRDIEVELSRKISTSATRSAEEATAQSAQQSGNERLLQRLRDIKPTGRIVLQLPFDAKDLPDLALEDGDRIYVPALPTTVGVFGSVFNAGSFLYLGERSVEDYLRLAGSATRGADTKSIFVVRANGSVVSAQQDSGWLGFNKATLSAQRIYPGDTVFVPEELNKTTFLQDAKDWTQVLYQFGIGIAGLRSATK